MNLGHLAHLRSASLTDLVLAGQDAKIDAIKKQVEDLDRTVEQLKRREEALTSGDQVSPEQAEVIKTSIDRRIKAVEEDKSELQAELQKIIMQKCGQPGKRRK